jgi:hypothetical protein
MMRIQLMAFLLPMALIGCSDDTKELDDYDVEDPAPTTTADPPVGSDGGDDDGDDDGADGSADSDGAADSDGSPDTGGEMDADESADADGAADDDTGDDTGEAPPDFEVDGVYEGTFSVALTVSVLDLTDTCSGTVSFHVEEGLADSSEEAEDTGAGPTPTISGTGACSFTEDGALSGFVDAGMLESLGPFEGATTGDVLTRPGAAGELVIDTSIGGLAAEWTGEFAPATDDAAATLNGGLEGSLEVDTSEAGLIFGVLEIEYSGSFTTTRTGDLPSDAPVEDTGSADADDTGSSGDTGTEADSSD